MTSPGARPPGSGQPVRRITVDEARCEGYGNCQEVAPTVFSLGDEGAVDVLIPDNAVPADLAGQVDLATRSCPVGALEIST